MISLHHRPLPLPPRFPKRLLRMRDVVHLGRSELHSPHGANKAPSSSQCGKRSESLHPALTVGAWEGSLKKNNTCWIINGARCDEARAFQFPGVTHKPSMFSSFLSFSWIRHLVLRFSRRSDCVRPVSQRTPSKCE